MTNSIQDQYVIVPTAQITMRCPSLSQNRKVSKSNNFVINSQNFVEKGFRLGSESQLIKVKFDSVFYEVSKYLGNT